MKLKTIWTIPAMDVRERLRRTRDWAAMTVARHLPLRIRYWATIAEIARATMKSDNVPATPLDEVLRGLQTPKNLS